MDYFMKRQSMPGYTGHIPLKKDTFGITAGEINRQLMLGGDSADSKIYRNNYYNQEKDFDSLKTCKHDDCRKFGNRSKYASTWIGGIDQHIYPQHIPGILIKTN
jgi:hypothetical protein